MCHFIWLGDESWSYRISQPLNGDLSFLFLLFSILLAAFFLFSLIDDHLRDPPALFHLTSIEGAIVIVAAGTISGRAGVFAVPKAVSLLSPAVRAVVTLLPINRVAAMVPIHARWLHKFRRIHPIGPYSLLKFVVANYYAPYRSVYLDGRAPDGACPVASRIWIYSPDVFTWLAIVMFYFAQPG